MADSKITALTALTAADPANDMIPIVDVSDTPPASGNTKRISINNLLACSPSATLASATITGDLTVNTNVLKVDSTNDRVGIGTASPALPLEIYKASGDSKMRITSGSNTLTFGWDDPNGFYYTASTSLMAWQLSGSTAMTLNSTGLGVGVSPAVLLDIQSASAVIRATSSTGTNTSFAAFANTGGAVRVGAENSAGGGLFTGSSAYSAVLGTTGAYSAHIGTNGVVRATVDSSGNVGIGVTPSAWASFFKAIQINNRGAYISATSNSFSSAPFVQVGNNGYYDTTNSRWEYVTANAAAQYVQAANSHLWYTAASGAADAEITDFATAKMTLDASGNLILLPPSTPPTLATNGQLTVNATSDTNLRFSYRGSDGVTRTANLTLA